MASIASIHAQLIQPQLPVAWYVDPQVYTLEAAHLFAHTPSYLGHELMLPNVGDYRVLDWSGEAKSLVHDKNGISVISNVCRHRQAIMLKGNGNKKNIVCPLHHWTYDLEGKLLAAPHFNENPCLHLQHKPLQNWQGLLFDGKRDIAKDLAKLGCTQDFDFTDYKFDSVKIEHYNFNWKTFIEAYLEDYHVGPFHPGLNQFVDCSELAWDFGEHFSAQTVGFKQREVKNNAPVYQKWHQTAVQYNKNITPHQTPKHGAIWFAYYPFLMVEWYPNVLVVSHLIPTDVDHCSNVTEFYYPKDIALFECELIAAQQAAYFETAVEDKEICQRMHDGRRALFAQGIDQRGPYQHPMESGLEHFHRWYRNQLQAFMPLV